MSYRNGTKARAHQKRKAKIAHRVGIRALRLQAQTPKPLPETKLAAA
jgi:hypothetical protein